MNFKKFISGVSALAIAASAFAGMAVTANAAETSTQLYSQTALNKDLVTAVGAVTLTDGADTDNGIASFINVKTTDTGKSTKGFTLTTGVSKSSGLVEVQYKIRLNEVTGTNVYTGIKNSGNTISGAYFRSGRTNAWGNTGWTGSNVSTVGTAWTAGNWYIVSERVNLTSKSIYNFKVTTLDGATTLVDQANGFSADWSGVSSLTFISIAQNSAANSADFDIADVVINDVKIDAETLTINYVDTDGNALKTATVNNLTGKYVGDTSDTYYYPKYIAKDGYLYKVKASSFGATTPLKGSDTAVNVTYEATNTQGAFYEGEGNGGNTSDGIKDCSRFSSGAGTRHIDGSQGSYKVVSVAAPADGIYTISVSGVTARSGEGYLAVYNNEQTSEKLLGVIDARYRTISKDDTTAAYASYANVKMKAGEKIIVRGCSAEDGTGNNGNVGVDYVLFEKVGDVASAELNNTVNTYDTHNDPIVKAYTFEAAPTKIGDAYQALNSVTVTVKVEGYEDKVQTKTAAEFGTISGPATFAILIAGAENPTITVTAN